MKISVKEQGRLLDFLRAKLHPVSNTKVRKLIEHGRVTVDGEASDTPDQKLLPGQIVEITRQTHPSPFRVLYEDPYVLAAEKPPGLLAIGTDTERSATFYKEVYRYVRHRPDNRERIFIVHRLDREASGIMLFAKTKAVKESLQRRWAQVEKLYIALVEGHPPEARGTLRSWLVEGAGHTVYPSSEDSDGKCAITHYQVRRRFSRHTLLEIRIETGRKHQIRVHLAEIGCPIVGDRKYGATGNPIRRLGLHAFSLSFTHPVLGRRMTVESPMPKIFMAFGKPHLT